MKFRVYTKIDIKLGQRDFNTSLSTRIVFLVYQRLTKERFDHCLYCQFLLYLISLSNCSDCTNKKKKKNEKEIDKLSLAFELHEGAYSSSFREKTVGEWREKKKEKT